MRRTLLIFLCLAFAPGSHPQGSDDDKLKPTPAQRAVIDLVNAYFDRSQSPEEFGAGKAKEKALEALKKYFASHGGSADDQKALAFLKKMEQIHLEAEEKANAKHLARLKRSTH